METCKRLRKCAYPTTLLVRGSDFARFIFLQPYHSLQDVMKLVLKVKAQEKFGNSTTTKSVAKEGLLRILLLRIPVVLKLYPHSSSKG